ncbi:PASTA domain-containing protein [Robertkochia marina]|uniref:PASTA domain-containing protein n=1 Tax=Robertkochia marina TaxID=1227945 RepID=A0A4S3M1H6_9FLAO|nr:penicillin-binding protein [Robertkochia marina]THD68886.1 PASTA domain-containing protein [Robertkochia marina]TRZ41133.1 PASTA domain-containing protein [Robertkochia marina]
MAISEKNISNRLYVVAGCMFLFAIAVAVKLVTIQVVEGDHYKELAENRTVRKFVIEPNRGNLYSDDGSLLATSVTRYDIRLDAITPSQEVFEENIKPLSDSLSVIFGKSPSYYQNLIRKARAARNRYLLIARDLGYTDYLRVRNFPMFRLGPFKGGLIVEQETQREHPLGSIAQRSVGWERFNPETGRYFGVGLERAFGTYLRGKQGKRLKQKIAKGQWKPITDYNEVEPQDGYDVVSTIDINIQDVAHHALLTQLEKYNADHGCVVVMEVETGEVKAISNLGRTQKGTYYERLNYAIGESHEPGSTFKLMSMIAAMEDDAVDTSTVIDTEKGVLSFYGKKVRDSRYGGYGEISASKVFEVSSNTGVVKIIDEFYGDQPEKFVNRIYNMGLHKPLGLPIAGEGTPIIPHPNDRDRWSGIALQWMAYGYGVELTPLQILTFYNAVANGGEMLKPRLIKEVRQWDDQVRNFEKEVINPSICSAETISKVQQMLKNVVEKEHGTGHKLYSPDFSMAGKTGTAQKNYSDKSKKQYISSFVGYFPAEKPKYSCIVVIHEPDQSVGYYGADVSGPVFKSIAQKIYTNSPLIDTVDELEKPQAPAVKSYEEYYAKAQKHYNHIPDVKGMSGMDAVSLLENMGLKVEVEGNGKVVTQFPREGEAINKNKKVILKLS